MNKQIKVGSERIIVRGPLNGMRCTVTGYEGKRLLCKRGAMRVSIRPSMTKPAPVSKLNRSMKSAASALLAESFVPSPAGMRDEVIVSKRALSDAAKRLQKMVREHNRLVDRVSERCASKLKNAALSAADENAYGRLMSACDNYFARDVGNLFI